MTVTLARTAVGGACKEERRERVERRDNTRQRADGTRDYVEWRQTPHGVRHAINAQRPQ